MSFKISKTLLITALVISNLNAKATPLIVHEWGTFTSFMGSQGKLIEGMHTEDEALPSFVYSLKKDGNITNLSNQAAPSTSSFLPPCNPNQSKVPCDTLLKLSNIDTQSNFIPVNPMNYGVTQKMETPVIYFYGEEGDEFDIKVDFPKGLMSQWYPKATKFGPSVNEIAKLGPSYLSYKVKLKSPSFIGNMPKTSFDSIWNPARKVKANTIEVDNQHEKFIFYRGIADFNSALKVESPSGNKLKLTNLVAKSISQIFILNSNGQKGIIKPLGELKSNSTKTISLPSIDNGFEQKIYIEKSKNLIVKSLVNSGLYEDEAKALVNTWEKSYFQTPGPRVLFILPREETDRILPLTISRDITSLVRVLIGRIEIMTKSQEDQAIELLLNLKNIQKEKLFGRFYGPKLRNLKNVILTSKGYDETKKEIVLSKINKLMRE